VGARVVVTDSNFADHDQETALLDAVGASLTIESCSSEDDVIGVSAGADILLVQWAPIGRRLFAARPEVRLVVRYGIGLDNIDLRAAAEYRVTVANVPDYCSDEVAEHAVMLLLAVQRRLLTFDRLTRSARWAEANAVSPPAKSIAEQSVGLIGFGRVGRRTAAILAGFGAQVRAFDPGLSQEQIGVAGVSYAATLADLSDCDVITLHCPLTDGTRGIVDAEFLASLPSHAIVINTSRGGVIDTEALVNALQQGHIGGAGLDTFDPEPLPADHPLLGFPNVVATPHVAWMSDAARIRLQQEVGREAVRYVSGEPLRCAAVDGRSRNGAAADS
jgi:D-3-phosphoglycerate dehydrogenase / 2-oxoglutarate reductase